MQGSFVERPPAHRVHSGRRPCAPRRPDLRRGRALAVIDTLPAPTELFDAAGAIGVPGLRTLDALHLATAVGLGESWTGIITYDKRLAEAATAAGLDVFAPG